MSRSDSNGRTFDLEERLLLFSARIVRMVEALPRTAAGRHVADHLLRSGTSPYFHHGEAESAESKADFVHKISVCLKELRESLRCLRLIAEVPLIDSPRKLTLLMKENDELIRIFVTSLATARKASRTQERT